MNDQDGPVPFWIIVSAHGRQAPMEAFDDWFANREDADQVARQLANDTA